MHAINSHGYSHVSAMKANCPRLKLKTSSRQRSSANVCVPFQPPPPSRQTHEFHSCKLPHLHRKSSVCGIATAATSGALGAGTAAEPGFDCGAARVERMGMVGSRALRSSGGRLGKRARGRQWLWIAADGIWGGGLETLNKCGTLRRPIKTAQSSWAYQNPFVQISCPSNPSFRVIQRLELIL